MTSPQNALSDPTARVEDFDLIRRLIAKLRLVPEETGLAIEFRGGLAAIQTVCAANENAALGGAAIMQRIKLVVGES